MFYQTSPWPRPHFIFYGSRSATVRRPRSSGTGRKLTCGSASSSSARGHSSLAGGQGPDPKGQSHWDAGAAEGAHEPMGGGEGAEPLGPRLRRGPQRRRFCGGIPCWHTSEPTHTHARTQYTRHLPLLSPSWCPMQSFRHSRNTAHLRASSSTQLRGCPPLGTPNWTSWLGKLAIQLPLGPRWSPPDWLLLQGVAGHQVDAAFGLLEALCFSIQRELPEKGQLIWGVPFSWPWSPGELAHGGYGPWRVTHNYPAWRVFHGDALGGPGTHRWHCGTSRWCCLPRPWAVGGGWWNPHSAWGPPVLHELTTSLTHWPPAARQVEKRFPPPPPPPVVLCLLDKRWNECTYCVTCCGFYSGIHFIFFFMWVRI